MATEENKAIARRMYEEVVNGGNLEAAEEFFAPDFREHNAPPGLAGGIEGLKQMVGMFRGAFPDLRGTIEDMVAEGDRVAVRLTSRGTQSGPFLGMAPTGKAVAWEAIHILSFSDGKIVERRLVADMMSLMGQLRGN